MLPRALFAFLVAGCLLGAEAHAVVIYDESIDGESTGNFQAGTAPNLGLLAGGSFDIIGSLDGGVGQVAGPDEFDDFAFSTSGNWTLDAISVVGKPLVPALFVLPISQVAVNGNVTTGMTDVLGVQGAGQWFLRLLPQGNADANTYHVRINAAGSAVPESPSLALMVLGLAGLGLRARKS